MTAANPTGDGRTWQLGFFGPATVGSSLPDGRYILRISATAAPNALGQPMTADYVVAFHRFFGDGDGDADVDTADQSHFNKTSGSSLFATRYESAFRLQ